MEAVPSIVVEDISLSGSCFFYSIIGKPPENPEQSRTCPENPEQDRETIQGITQHLKEHPSIKEIKKYYSTKEPIKLFSISEASTGNIIVNY